MLLKDGGRTSGRDWPLQRLLNRIGLACIRDGQNDKGACHDLANAHGNGGVRHVLECGEPPFSELLASADFIEFNDNVRMIHIEISRWIVEGEVPILPDASEGHINWVRLDQLADPRDLRLEIRRIPMDEVERAKGRELRREPFVELAAEACGMGVRHADILIEVEACNLRPINIWLLYQSVEHFELARASCDGDVSLTLCCDRVADCPRSHRGGGFSKG